ncbi:MAG: glycosyltransferase family A protein [Candidatus Omnitrophota bacterium]
MSYSPSGPDKFILLRRKPRAFKLKDERAGRGGDEHRIAGFSAPEDSANRRMETPAFRPESFIPAVSVVIVAYNHAEYIGQAIQSVLDQTFGDFEVVVFDDGSRDNTKDVVASFHDERIKYYRQENSGLPAKGRNAGMRLARGRYIALMDGDDFWYKEKLDKSIRALDTMKDVSLICHNEDIIYGTRILPHKSYGPYRADMYSSLLFNGNCLHSSAVTIRREVFFDDGMRFCEDKDLFAIEDYEYWMRLSRRYKFYFLPDRLGCYRVIDKGAFLSSNETNTKNLLCLLERHFSKLNRQDDKFRAMARRRRSSVMCAAGRMQQHKANFKESGRWYIMALREYPFNYKALIGLALSTLRIKLFYG